MNPMKNKQTNKQKTKANKQKQKPEQNKERWDIYFSKSKLCHHELVSIYRDHSEYGLSARARYNWPIPYTVWFLICENNGSN